MKCKDCGNEMVLANLHGEPFKIDMDHEINKFTIKIPTNETENFLGLEFQKNIELPLKAKVCQKCGKVELYVEINN